MGTRQRLKQCVGPCRGTTLASALAVAFFALTPVALGAPGDEQYNFNPPNPGDGGSDTSSGTGTTLPGADGQGPAGPNAAKSNGKRDDEKAGNKGGATGLESSGLLETSSSSSSPSPDRSALSAFFDSIGLGLMPIVLGAIAAIGVAGASIALYRRRGKGAHGEPA